MTPILPDWTQMRLVMPEVWLIAAMCGVILVPFVKRESVLLPTLVALGGLLMAMLATLATLSDPGSLGFIFSGMVTVDCFSQFFKILLILFTMLVLAQWWIVSRKQTHVYDVPDFLCLLLGAVVGMSLMVSAGSLVMIFLAIESASLPSYVLAGFRKNHRIGSEGSLKYVIFGSASSAIMIYGMSLIYGSTGTLSLPGIVQAASAGITPLMAVGLAGMFVGLAFKLSAVPVHFWCPDVFQAAPIEVTTFLSVASKGAAICLLVRVLHAFGQIPLGVDGLVIGVAIVGGVTATWGNLLALRQTNFKRLLAYSSIAHAGYMIMAASLLAGVDGVDAQNISGAILFYLLVYLFMNLGAFTVGALVAQETGSDDLKDYTGLVSRCPVLAVLLTIFLLSLFGMPGLGGFMGKIYLMVSMTDTGPMGYVLSGVILFNTLLSLYFYLRPVYFMILTKEDQPRPAFLPRGLGLAVLMGCAAVLFWTGLYPAAASGLTHDFAVVIVSDRAHLSAMAAPPIAPESLLLSDALETLHP